MNRVRVKDLALVAAAGGLLAVELVSIGEVLPNVKKALAERGLSERVEIASASAVGVPLPVVEPAAPMVSPALASAAKSHAHMVASSTSAAHSKRCAAMARARDGRRAHGGMPVVTVATDGSCTVGVVAQTVERRREVEKTVRLALKQSTL
jgi:hypothetical protein